MKKFFQEFKAFAMRGNVMELAIGVIIGAAFQGVIASLTDNILSPIIGLFTRGNLNNLAATIPGLNVTITYGAFLTSLINFVILLFVVFLLVKGMNRLLKKKDAPPDTKKCPYCCTDIPVNATRCPNCTAELPTAEAGKT